MPTNAYMTPSISKVIPMLTQTCDELTRQALIRSLTQKTQEWVEGDPELADILLDGKKTLEECVRYVTEKAAGVISKNINAMQSAEIAQLPRMKIQGREATMAGGAVDAEQVYRWAQEYYYNPDIKAANFNKETKKPTEKKAGAVKKADSQKGAVKKAEAGVKQPLDTAKSAAKDKASDVTDKCEQMSMFGSPAAGDTAAA